MACRSMQEMIAERTATSGRRTWNLSECLNCIDCLRKCKLGNIGRCRVFYAWPTTTITREPVRCCQQLFNYFHYHYRHCSIYHSQSGLQLAATAHSYMESRMSQEGGQPGAMGSTSVPRSVSVSDAITLFEQKSRSSSTSMSRSSSRSVIYMNTTSSPSGSSNAVKSESRIKHPPRSPSNTAVSISGDAQPQLAEVSVSSKSRSMDVASDTGEANEIGVRGVPTIRPQRSASRPMVPKRVASNTSATTSASRTPPASPRNHPGRSISNVSSSSSRASLANGSASNKAIGIGIGVPSTVRSRDARRASDTASIRPRSPRTSYIAPNRQPFPHSISAPRSLSSQSYGVEHDDFSPRSERSQSPFHLQPAISVSQATPEKLLPPLYMQSSRSDLPRRTNGIPIPLSRHTSISSTPSAYYTPPSSKSPMSSELEQKREDVTKSSILDGYFRNSFGRDTSFGPEPIKLATTLEQTRSDLSIAPDMDRRSSAMELYRRKDSSGSISESLSDYLRTVLEKQLADNSILCSLPEVFQTTSVFRCTFG